MNPLKKLAGETVLYGLGSIVPRFLNFLLVNIQTRAFLPEKYGVLTNLYAYVAVINIVFMFGMETAYFRFATKPGADPNRIFNLAQTVVVAISVFLSGIFILFSNSLATALDIPGQGTLVIGLVATMFIDALVAIPFARLRLEKKAKLFAVGKLANVIILVALNVYFLIIAFDPSIGVGFVVMANLIANTFYFLFFFKTIFSWRPKIDLEISPSMFRYAYPIMIMGLAGMTNEMFSRLTLKWWLPADFYLGQSPEYALGVFGACYKFGMLMSLTVTAFRYAAEPFFFSNASNKNSPHLFAKVNHYFILVCCVLLLGVSINLDILKYFLGRNEYWDGLAIVPILLLAYLFLGAYYNFSTWFKLTDKTYFGTILTLVGSVITIVANFVLIPKLGYLGSSIAALLCYFFMALGCYVLGQKFFPIPYGIRRGLTYIIGTVILVYLVNLVKLPNQLIATGFHFLVIVAYLYILYLLEKDYFRQPIT
jgi:O-antigen/teichoic acid export membrane protein